MMLKMLPKENSALSSPVKESSINEQANQLANRLSAAIQAGETELAKEIVGQLANLKLKLDISVPQEDFEQRCKEKEFSVRVHVEDRISDGCYFTLMVKACDTIEDLKKKVMLKHNFPLEVQRWIIGKKIFGDKNKLGQCGIKGPNHTIYLYLVTARSVGLTQPEYEQHRQAIIEGRPYQPSSFSQNESRDDTSTWTLTQYPKMSSSHSPINYAMQGLDEIESNIINSGMHSRQASKASLSSTSSFLQDFIAAPGNVSQNSTIQNSSSERPKSVSSEQGIVIESASISSGYRSRTPPRSPSNKKNELPVAGWQCSVCTLINLPTRPGCEVCAADRPKSYCIPAGYQLTPEELALYENDQRFERMTREAEPPTGSPLRTRSPSLSRANQRSSRHSDLINEQHLELTRALNYEASVQNQLLSENPNWPDMLASSFEELDEDPTPRADQPNILQARSSSPSPKYDVKNHNVRAEISKDSPFLRYSKFASVMNRNPEEQLISDEENAHT
ncbi:hypothetical protein Btru_011181 [Bulinus truncatus]|nr:hypothetical protein Btru_011181 [Bulinus truncatus]